LQRNIHPNLEKLLLSSTEEPGEMFHFPKSLTLNLKAIIIITLNEVVIFIDERVEGKAKKYSSNFE